MKTARILKGKPLAYYSTGRDKIGIKHEQLKLKLRSLRAIMELLLGPLF